VGIWGFYGGSRRFFFMQVRDGSVNWNPIPMAAMANAVVSLWRGTPYSCIFLSYFPFRLSVCLTLSVCVLSYSVLWIFARGKLIHIHNYDRLIRSPYIDATFKWTWECFFTHAVESRSGKTTLYCIVCIVLYRFRCKLTERNLQSDSVQIKTMPQATCVSCQ